MPFSSFDEVLTVIKAEPYYTGGPSRFDSYPEHQKSLFKYFKMPGKKVAPAEAPGLNPPEVAERRKYWHLRKNAHNLFLTLSTADLHWDDLMCHLPNYPEWLAGDAATRRRIARNNLQNNPHIIAQWFDIRFRLFQGKVLKRLFSVMTPDLAMSGRVGDRSTTMLYTGSADALTLTFSI
ncbi:unnamed protein product [Penicillium viridicatum]